LIIFASILNADLKSGIQIIASTSCQLNQLSQSEIKEIFLKKKEYIQKKFIIPLDNPDKTIYTQFIHQYLHKSPRAMKAYWMRMLFTGKKIPLDKLKLTNLNQYKDTICYMSYIGKTGTLKEWKTIDVKP
jgi:myosin-crossreactive antigen